MKRMPRRITLAFRAIAKSTSSPSKQATSTFGNGVTTSRSISIRSSTENSGAFASFSRIATTSRPKIRDPRSITSRGPLLLLQFQPPHDWVAQHHEFPGLRRHPLSPPNHPRRCVGPARRPRPRNADPQPQVADLLPPPLLRLPHQPVCRYPP